MATLFSDNFDRANNTDLGTSWTEVKGNHQIVSNALQLAAYNGANNFADVRANTTAHVAVADCKVTGKRVSGSSFDSLVYARGSGTDSTVTGYVLNIYGSNNIEVYRFNSGASTLIGARNATHANADTYSLEVSGTGATVTLKVYRNGSQVGANLTDTSGSRITAAGQTGLGNWATGACTWDDFLVEDLGGTQSVSYSATGGLALSGAAAKIAARALSAAGGLALSGAAAQLRTVTRGAAGGVALSGAARFAIGQTVTPAGGLSLIGTAAQIRVRVPAPTGGVTLSGEAGYATSGTQQFSYTAQGGLTVSGAAAHAYMAAIVATGGVQLGGSAAASFHEQQRMVTPAGGIVLGGNAAVTTFTVGGGNGGELLRRRRRRLR